PDAVHQFRQARFDFGNRQGLRHYGDPGRAKKVDHNSGQLAFYGPGLPQSTRPAPVRALAASRSFLRAALPFARLGAPRPESPARQTRALGERLEFRPGDLGASHPGAQAAVGSAHDVLAAEELRVPQQALGDELGMLDEVAAMPDDAGGGPRVLRRLR